MRSPNSNELCTVPRYTEMMPKATIDSQWTGDPQSHAPGLNNRPADVRSATVPAFFPVEIGYGDSVIPS
jgi:hypothetical protein